MCDTEFLQVILKIVTARGNKDSVPARSALGGLRPLYIPESRLWRVQQDEHGYYDAGPTSDLTEIHTRVFLRFGYALAIRDTCQHGAALLRSEKVADAVVGAYWVPRQDKPCALGIARCFYLVSTGDLIFHKLHLVNTATTQADLWERFAKGAGIQVNFAAPSISKALIKLLAKALHKCHY